MVEDHFFIQSGRNQFLSDQDYGPGPGIYYYQQFKLDMAYDMYDREVYTIIGVVQSVGGFYNALYFLMLFLHSQFSGTIFFSALISKLYHVEVGESKKSRDIAKAARKEIAKSGAVKLSILIQIKEYLGSRRRIDIRSRDIFNQAISKIWCCRDQPKNPDGSLALAERRN